MKKLCNSLAQSVAASMIMQGAFQKIKNNFSINKKWVKDYPDWVLNTGAWGTFDANKIWMQKLNECAKKYGGFEAFSLSVAFSTGKYDIAYAQGDPDYLYYVYISPFLSPLIW